MLLRIVTSFKEINLQWSAGNSVPNMPAMICAFKTRPVTFGNGDDILAPYFAGYCGTHISLHPGQTLEQLGGPFQFNFGPESMFFSHSNGLTYTSVSAGRKGKRRASLSFGKYMYCVFLISILSYFVEDKPKYKLLTCL